MDLLTSTEKYINEKEKTYDIHASPSYTFLRLTHVSLVKDITIILFVGMERERSGHESGLDGHLEAFPCLSSIRCPVVGKPVRQHKCLQDL